jgi:hypothetical protein
MSAAVEISAEFFSPDVLDFLRWLDHENVRYLIVGGEAVIFYGYPRLTGDIDFFYDSEPVNCQRLFNALLSFWEGLIPGISTSSELEAPGLILQFGRPPHRIDLLNRIDGVSFAEAWPNRLPVTLFGEAVRVPVWYLGKAELLRNKRASGRPKDLDDLEHLS